MGPITVGETSWGLFRRRMTAKAAGFTGKTSARLQLDDRNYFCCLVCLLSRPTDNVLQRSWQLFRSRYPSRSCRKAGRVRRTSSPSDTSARPPTATLSPSVPTSSPMHAEYVHLQSISCIASADINVEATQAHFFRRRPHPGAGQCQEGRGRRRWRD